MENDGLKYYQIGEIATIVDMSPRTIRYYEEIGLLNSVKRIEGGKRVYTDKDLQRLKFITRLVRTAIGNFFGGLSSFTATELGGKVIEEAVRRSKIRKEDVDEVIMGNVLPFGLGQNPARQAMIKAGLPMSGGAITVNKVCGSGLKAAMLAAQAITA